MSELIKLLTENRDDLLVKERKQCQQLLTKMSRW